VAFIKEDISTNSPYCAIGTLTCSISSSMEACSHMVIAATTLMVRMEEVIKAKHLDSFLLDWLV
jgi:hypothetical protein